MKRCGITRGDQPTAQRQPRVSGNALPNGFSGPTAAPAPSATGGSGKPTGSATSSQIRSPAPTNFGAVGSNNENGTGNGKLSPTTIALAVLVAVMGAGYVALAIAYVLRRRAEKNARTQGFTYYQTGGESAPHTPMFQNEKNLTGPRSTPYDPPKSSL